jgi:hypothetical protein
VPGSDRRSPPPLVVGTRSRRITVTVVTPRTDPESGQSIADVSVSVPATTGDRMIGPFPAHSFADPTDGLADITYSSATSVTVAVFKLQE